eukprot:gene578-810_t
MHAKTLRLVVANARHSLSYGCALRLGPVNTNFGDRVARPGGWMQGAGAQQGRNLASTGNAADDPRPGNPKGRPSPARHSSLRSWRIGTPARAFATPKLVLTGPRSEAFSRAFRLPAHDALALQPVFIQNLRTTTMNALLSVSDKTGIVEFAQALHALGIKLLSTGGTAKLLVDGGLPVTEVADHTGFPEMLDGRVKTLHPKIHGGLLARRDLPEHRAALTAHQIDTIDLLVVNLYPFEATVAKPDCTLEDAIGLRHRGFKR